MVGRSNQIEQIVINDADIPGIMSLIRHAESQGAQFIKPELIRSIKGKTEKETFYNLWKMLRSGITYIPDGEIQRVQSPGALWKSGTGDCKSFAVFVASVLQKMCLPYELVLDRYEASRPNHGHIYVRSNGVIIDPVNPVFNRQDSVWRRKTYRGIDYCSTVGSRPAKPASAGIFLLILLIALVYE